MVLKTKRRSDPVLGQKPLHQQKCQKGKLQHKQRHKKVRLHSDCGPTCTQVKTQVKTISYYSKYLLEYVLCPRIFLTTLYEPDNLTTLTTLYEPDNLTTRTTLYEHYKFQTILMSITRNRRISYSTYSCLKNELLNRKDIIINIYKTYFD